MVNVQTMRAFLRNHYKAGNDDTANALIDAGLDDYEIFQDFSNKDMHNLCAAVRKPGGQILVNNVSQPNPDVNVPPLCEMRLKLGAYAAKYYTLVGRHINAQSMSWVYVKHFTKLRTLTDNHKDPDNTPELSKKVIISKVIPLMEEHLRGVLGVNKLPLSYLIRGNPEVPDLFLNPMRGGTTPEGPYGTAYNSFSGEMIACAPHGTPKYDEDNATLMNILTELVSGTHHEAPIKPYKRARDGRGAFLALSQHNLGNNRFGALSWTGREVSRKMGRVRK